MMVSVLTMLDISRPVSGGVIAERDEFERAGVAFRVAHAVHATALVKDRDAWADGNLSARLRPEPIDVRRWIDERIARVHCGVVAIANVGDPFALAPSSHFDRARAVSLRRPARRRAG